MTALGGPPPEGPSVEAPICILGDVHGCRTLLERLLDRLARDEPDALIVTVGDYVDRGPDSRGVLRLVAERADVALMGNHEDMLLSFLDDPAGAGPLWLLNGGGATLESFGIDPVAASLDEVALVETGRALAKALGGAADWLRERPLWWRSGDLFVSHAGGDPERAPEEQARRDLLWGHPGFGRTRRRDGLWVAHGHTIVDEPFAAGRRIATDTGAFATGRLTAAIVRPDAPVRFVQA